jgi:actin
MLQCPELLFQPNLQGKPIEGLHNSLFNSIQECNEASREVLYRNIVLSGGTSMLAGMGQRVYKELRNLASTTEKISVLAPNDREYSSWIGGSIIAALSTFQDFAISRQEYYEEGASVARKKCL